MRKHVNSMFDRVTLALFLSKTLFLILLMGINGGVSCFEKSHSFTIEGTLETELTGRLLLWTPKEDSTFRLNSESIEIDGKNFVIKGCLDYPQLTFLSFEDTLYRESHWFFIEPGINRLNVSIDHEKIIVSSDAPTQEDYLELREEREIYKNVDTLIAYIKENKNSYVAAHFVKRLIMQSDYDPKLEKAIQTFDREFQSTKVGKELYEFLENRKRLSEGSLFPDIIISDRNGIQKSISNITYEKYLVLDFWFHNCAYCIAQFPEYRELNNKFHPLGVEIAMISTDLERFKNLWIVTIDKHNLPWLHYIDHSSTMTKDYGLNSFPTNFVLDRTGSIVAKNLTVLQVDSLLTTKLY